MDTQPTPTNPISPEHQPGVVMPEVPGAGEAGAQAPTGGGSATPSAKPTLTADEVAAVIAATPSQGVIPGSTSAAAAPNPVEAADQDVIEPEWVDKAEAVVEQNAGNPFAEEEAVEDLQIDYLKKRYGHEVKKSEDT